MINIRPQGLSEYVGQDEVKGKMSMLVSVYKKTGKVPEPILLTAKPGRGKTSLARAFANDMGTDYIEVYSPLLKKEEDVFNLLRNGGKGIKRGSTILLDEVHSLSPVAQLLLLPILEDRKLTHGGHTWNFPDWCWIFATTNPGMISRPVYDRIVNKCELVDYTIDELTSIGNATANKLNVNIEPEVLVKLSSISFGTPRLINGFIKSLSNYMIAHDIEYFTTQYLSKFLAFSGVNNIGLTRHDLTYLDCLYSNTLNGTRVPVGGKAILKRTGLTADEVDNLIEPKLLSLSFIGLSGKGRFITDKGLDYLADNVYNRI